ncbi:MAG: aminoacetone oxidase family FAD-binding enzyme [Bacilli bacterium]|nr:aminoacetone oxidase family FAD-binding enzyme [Bacilli bacterium]
MRIIIIGGGPSGVVAALNAKNEQNEVIILERNDKLLKKLLLTGNGRCNYFNENFSLSDYDSYDESKIEQIITEKNIWNTRLFFEQLGIVPKIKNGYYYPYTNQASTIRNMLIHELNNKNISIFYNTYVSNIEKRDGRFFIQTNNREFYAERVVIATGSFAYPSTGCDGSGYSILKKFGHSVIPPLPALVQLKSNFPYVKEWDGIRSEVRVDLYENDKYVDSELGEIQLTNFGISGICVFNLSNRVTRGIFNHKKEVIKINFVPFIEALITPWMERYSKKQSTKNIQLLLEGFINQKLVPIILKCADIDGSKFYSDLSTEERKTLCNYLTQFPVEITGTKGYDNCQICNGGVRLSEIDLETMESYLVRGLYITGELLDLNGKCGGYNLTTCWISGLLAGNSLKEKDD